MSVPAGSNNNPANASTTIPLKVLETYTRYGPGVVAIDEITMSSIGAALGDIVEIQGKKKALAKIVSLYPAESGKKVARFDKNTRTNAGIEIGNTVVIRRVFHVPPAEKVILLPLIPIPGVDEQYFSDELDGLPLTSDSEIMIPYMGTRIPFRVAEIVPDSRSSPESPAAAVVNQKTVFLFKPIAVS